MLCDKCNGKGRSPAPSREVNVRETICSACNGSGRQERFIEIAGTGECPQSHDKKHKFIMISFPNPEYWGEEIEKSTYEFMCWHCGLKVEVPYAEAQKEQISVFQLVE